MQGYEASRYFRILAFHSVREEGNSPVQALRGLLYPLIMGLVCYGGSRSLAGEVLAHEAHRYVGCGGVGYGGDDAGQHSAGVRSAELRRDPSRLKIDWTASGPQ